MARCTGPMTKKPRRLEIDLVGGDKAFERHPYLFGIRGRGRTRNSEYSLQLEEKQEMCFTRGVLEKQFRRCYEEADRHPDETGDTLLQILESRLNNVVYCTGFAAIRHQTHQLVVHGRSLINGKKIDIPLCRVKAHNIVDVAEKPTNPRPLAMARRAHGECAVPTWLETHPSWICILAHQLPVRKQIVIDVREQVIVRFYSK